MIGVNECFGSAKELLCPLGSDHHKLEAVGNCLEAILYGNSGHSRPRKTSGGGMNISP